MFRYRDEAGVQHTLSFGSVDKVPRAVAQAELYQKLQTTADPGREKTPNSALVSVKEACRQYLEWANTVYRDEDGRQTGEASNLLHGLQPLVDLFPHLAAASLRPRHIKEFCEAQAKAKVSRGVINKRIGYIKRMLTWAKNEEIIPPVRAPGDLVPVGAFDACRDFPLLRQGRPVRTGGTVAREAKAVRVVPDETVNQTLPFLAETVKKMIELQQLTSMRPAEVCKLRMADVQIDRTPWLFEPARHKTRRHGKVRRIYFGPKARELLKPYLLRRDTFVFRPKDARADRPDLDLRGGQERYTTRTYRDAIWRACDRAFPAPDEVRGAFFELKRYRAAQAKAETPEPPPEDLVKRAKAEAAWWAAHRWSPNRLRHNGLSDIVDRELAKAKEKAQSVAGHSSAKTTEIYLSQNDELAAAVMEAAG
jgi:integrase